MSYTYDTTLSAQENIQVIKDEMADEYRAEGGFIVAYHDFGMEAFDKYYQMAEARNEAFTTQDHEEAFEDSLDYRVGA
jgi:hypothetical protein